MKIRILLVDDEAAMLEIHQWNLTQAGYEVVTATDGQDALTILSNQNPFQLIISDIRMPKLDGIQLVSRVTNTMPGVKIILMTGFALLMDAKQALDMGCEGFLPKPITKEDLLKAVQSALIPASEAIFDATAYAKIPLEDFIFGKSIPYPIYIRIGKKFIKISYGADELENDRIAVLKNKGVHELWLERADFEKYTVVVQKILKLAESKKDLGDPKRAALARHAANIVIEYLRLHQNSKSALKLTYDTWDSACNILNNDRMVEFMQQSILSVTPKNSANHAVVCAQIALIASRVLDWSSTRNAFISSLAALLHDIALWNTPLADKDPDTYTAEERKLYETHPEEGALLLESIPSIPRECARIIREHHEVLLGTGFPCKLDKSAIFPMARMVSLISRMAWMLLNVTPELRSHEAQQILTKLQDREPGAHDPGDIYVLQLAFLEKNPEKARAKFGQSMGLSKK